MNHNSVCLRCHAQAPQTVLDTLLGVTLFTVQGFIILEEVQKNDRNKKNKTN